MLTYGSIQIPYFETNVQQFRQLWSGQNGRNFDEDINVIKRLIILLKMVHMRQYLQNIGSIHCTNDLLFDLCQPEFPPFISSAQQIGYPQVWA
jgi:hypothetical protein